MDNAGGIKVKLNFGEKESTGEAAMAGIFCIIRKESNVSGHGIVCSLGQR